MVGSPHSAASSAIVAAPPLVATEALLVAITALLVATALRVATAASANIKFGGLKTDGTPVSSGPAYPSVSIDGTTPPDSLIYVFLGQAKTCMY